MFEPEKTIEQICSWMKEQVYQAGAKGIVFGLSGGIDSAVVGFLGKQVFGDNVLGVLMPCHSMSEDAQHAFLVAEAGDIRTCIAKLDAVFDTMLTAVGDTGVNNPAIAMARANIKPRLRMTVLYYYAQQYNLLVAGTGNLSEKTIGYFTKHGDSGVDIFPIADLVKSEIREIAKILGVPEIIIAKVPSAGLWEGQTDEGEMGFSYQELDSYIRSGTAGPEATGRIKSMMEASRHKLVFPPVCLIDNEWN